jgi:hypothetical protein
MDSRVQWNFTLPHYSNARRLLAAQNGLLSLMDGFSLVKDKHHVDVHLSSFWRII